jgi:hypothetical protein
MTEDSIKSATTENPVESAKAKLAHTLASFDKSIQSAVLISESRIGIDHTGRQNKALFVFAKLIAHCLSIKLVLDSYQSAPDGVGLLDHSSIATLGRAATDASLMTMYISKPELKQDEWVLRRTVLYLHELFNRKRFLEATMPEADRKKLPFFGTYEAQKIKVRGQIETLAKKLFFSASVIEELLKGQTVFIGGARGAAREATWDVDNFEFQQSYLSNWVHSHPVSFLRADEQKISFSHPSEYQLNFCILVLEITARYLDGASSRMKTFTGSIKADPIGKLDE